MFNPIDHLMNLKGKDYLQVAWRLVWFREEHKDWGIDTQIVDHDKELKHIVYRAVISDESGRQIASATGSESARDFGDYIEKAETKAVGRALAMCGYGTQFTADELDEGSRIVDSPVERKPVPKAEKPKTAEEKLKDLTKNPTVEVVDGSSELEFFCSKCHKPIDEVLGKDGNMVTREALVALSRRKYGKTLCAGCMTKMKGEQSNG